MDEVLLYLALTLALSLACAAGTWFSYRAFVLYVKRYDKRYLKRSQRHARRRYDRLAPIAYSRRNDSPAEDDPAQDHWPEIIDV